MDNARAALQVAFTTIADFKTVLNGIPGTLCTVVAFRLSRTCQRIEDIHLACSTRHNIVSWMRRVQVTRIGKERHVFTELYPIAAMFVQQIVCRTSPCAIPHRRYQSRVACAAAPSVAAGPSDTKAERRSHVVVIGAGVGGICIAGRLARNGYDVTVCESNAQVGFDVIVCISNFTPQVRRTGLSMLETTQEIFSVSSHPTL